MRYLIQLFATYIKFQNAIKTMKLLIQRMMKQQRNILEKLSIKLSFIDFTISMETVADHLKDYDKEPPKTIEELGPLLQDMFGDRAFRYDHIKMDIGKTIVLLCKKPHLFHVRDPKTY